MDIKNLAKQLIKNAGVNSLNFLIPSHSYIFDEGKIFNPIVKDNTSTLMSLYGLLGKNEIDESYLPDWNSALLKKQLSNYDERVNSTSFKLGKALLEGLNGVASVEAENRPDYLKNQITSEDAPYARYFDTHQSKLTNPYLGANVTDNGNDYIVEGSYQGIRKKPVKYKIKYPKNKLYGYISNEE